MRFLSQSPKTSHFILNTNRSIQTPYNILSSDPCSGFDPSHDSYLLHSALVAQWAGKYGLTLAIMIHGKA